MVKDVLRWQFCARHNSWAVLSCRDNAQNCDLVIGNGIRENYFHKTDSSSWWRHQMETFSALLALCEENPSVTGEFPAQRPVTQNFDVFFDLRLKKRLSKQSRRRWLETPPCSLWRHCNLVIMQLWYGPRIRPINVAICYFIPQWHDEITREISGI